MGDPDGLIRFAGKYHLFWWGHAESPDLVHWNELPYPMKSGDDSFKYYSGSVVVDVDHTSKLGMANTPPMVALYTAHRKDGTEDQRISVSGDYTNFVHDPRNPVLRARTPAERDPDVFWHAPTSRWIMLLAVPEKHQLRFYASPDLKSWTFLSEFGPLGASEQNWEVPNLVELPIGGDGVQSRWVLFCGMGPNRIQYFTGAFDGTRFVADEASAPRWVDSGADFYAARAFRDYDDHGRTTCWMGWMGNWEYANDVPTSWGKGAQSIPRKIHLQNEGGGFRLVQTPLPALEHLRGTPASLPPGAIRGTVEVKEFQPATNTYEIETVFDLHTSAEALGLNLCVGGSHEVVVGYDTRTSTIHLDRRLAGNVAFHPRFPVVTSAPIPRPSDKLKLRVFVDQSSIEVFVNDGDLVFTSLIFPEPSDRAVQLFGVGGEVKLLSFTAWPLASIWKTPAEDAKSSPTRQ